MSYVMSKETKANLDDATKKVTDLSKECTTNQPRVTDVLKAAGGPLPGADIGMLNLARKVADGELVTVGMPAAAPAGSGSTGEAPPAGDAAGGPTAPIDLNTATLAELDTLPGVGPVLAQRILDWRTEHGQFATVDQLSDVPGIGDARLAQLRDLVQV